MVNHWNRAYTYFNHPSYFQEFVTLRTQACYLLCSDSLCLDLIRLPTWTTRKTRLNTTWLIRASHMSCRDHRYASMKHTWDVSRSCLSKTCCLWSHVRCPGCACSGCVVHGYMPVPNPFLLAFILDRPILVLVVSIRGIWTITKIMSIRTKAKMSQNIL